VLTVTGRDALPSLVIQMKETYHDSYKHKHQRDACVERD